MVKHYIIAGIIGAVITFVSLRSCGSENKPTTIETIRHDTVTEVVHFPVYGGEGKGVLKYTYSPRETLTIIEKDSIYLHDTISGFVATLDTIQNNDTLHLEYNYPSSMFRYQLNRAPIQVKYTNTVTTNTVEIRPEWYEHPLFVSGTTAAVLVGIFGVVR